MMDDIEGSGQRNFLGLSDAYSSREDSYFQLVPVPYEATSTYVSGSRQGPKAIIDASENLELYDHTLDLEPARVGIATHPMLPVFAADPRRMLLEIERAVDGIVGRNKLPVVLGGEHTVSLGAVRALANRGKFMLVCLDAHADMRDTYHGTTYSQACYLRRASELVDCCVLGVRSLSAGEARDIQNAGMRMVYADSLLEDACMKVDLGFIPDKIYLSIDLDVLDPSIMPATGTPEPGGLGWYEALSLLERIITGRRVLGFDVVELCPQPGNASPDFAAAKLIYKVMGLIIRASRNQREDWTRYGEEKTQEEATS